MTLTAHLYWSFRSPYSYLGTGQYREMTEKYDLDIKIKPVYPIAIRTPEFFTKADPQWIEYLVRDCFRTAEYRGIPFKWPRPDPVVMDNKTRSISKDQPYIYRLTRLGVLANRKGKGMAFIDAVSHGLWGDAIEDWHLPENLGPIVAKAGLDLAEMDQEIVELEEDIEAEISRNQDELTEAGHWGVPTLAFENEPFFGQDRIDMAVWRMKQNGLQKR